MIQQTTTIICDECKATAGPFRNQSATNARRDLESIGWTYLNKIDRCEECTAKHRQKPAVASRILKTNQ